jgi:hypothetical protein
MPLREETAKLITDPWFYVLAVPVVLLIGISKGGFAGGLGTIGVPLLALAVDPREAAGVLLPILCTMDLFSTWSFRKYWDRKNLAILLPAGVAGIAAGAWLFHSLNVDMIRLLVGILALYFVGHFVVNLLRRRLPAPRPAHRGRGYFWGSLAGLTSTVAHAGGPPLSLYLLPQRLNKTYLVGTTVIFFATINYVKLVPYAWLGQLSPGNLLTSLVLLPLAPIGVRLGVFLHHRVPETIFYWLCYGLLLVAGIRLCYQGAVNLAV